MGKRTQPNMNELVQVMRHLADVAALKHDPTAQWQHLIDGLGAIFQASQGALFVADDARPGRQLRMKQHIAASGGHPKWVQYQADFAVHNPPEADPYANACIVSDEPLQVWSRRQVLPDLSAQRQFSNAMDLIQTIEIGDGMICTFRTGLNRDRLVGFSLHRSRGDRPSRPSDPLLARLAIQEIRGLIERGHLALYPQRDVQLSPRLQQVLDRLLSGKNPKTIARELDLSVHTIREYVQAIYQQLGVHGREQLMARFVGR
ncbi:MAG TPA: helix-turn-helix transcriptional regulator [Tepidisphaeraceae bacterium]|jgi:DNA-binding CsgD family transcriptional regulator|nr:helix-turn-helix transcriptional regulator [Tepidisphaeraceae bacterium]